jgi:hypothetical protein
MMIARFLGLIISVVRLVESSFSFSLFCFLHRFSSSSYLILFDFDFDFARLDIPFFHQRNLLKSLRYFSLI